MRTDLGATTGPKLRLAALAAAAALVLTACGGGGSPADEAADAGPGADAAGDTTAADEVAAEAAPDPADTGEPQDAGDLDVDAWCELADSGAILLRYDDPALLAEHIEVLERMAELTTGEMRANHDAGVELRRKVLAVVEDVVDPDMDLAERRELLEGDSEGRQRVAAITETPEAMASEAALMGYHLDYCL